LLCLSVGLPVRPEGTNIIQGQVTVPYTPITAKVKDKIHHITGHEGTEGE